MASSLNVSSIERDTDVWFKETPVTFTSVGVDGLSGSSSLGEQAYMTKRIGSVKDRIRDSLIITQIFCLLYWIVQIYLNESYYQTIKSGLS